MSSTQMSPIEKMPAEIKHMLLLLMPDIASLAGLVHASPDYHAAYALKRETIFSTITIRELNLRGIYFCKPGISVELWLCDNKHVWTEDQEAERLRIFEYCYDQALTCTTGPKLTVEQSTTLLGINTTMLHMALEHPHMTEGIKLRMLISWEKRVTALPDRSGLSSLDLENCHYTLYLGQIICVMSLSMMKRLVQLGSDIED